MQPESATDGLGMPWRVTGESPGWKSQEAGVEGPQVLAAVIDTPAQERSSYSFLLLQLCVPSRTPAEWTMPSTFRVLSHMPVLSGNTLIDTPGSVLSLGTSQSNQVLNIPI